MLLLVDWNYIPRSILFVDGSIQDGDTLSPTDIEANLSTEVALTVLDVLELFVHHHKVCIMLHSQSYNILPVYLSVFFVSYVKSHDVLYKTEKKKVELW